MNIGPFQNTQTLGYSWQTNIQNPLMWRPEEKGENISASKKYREEKRAREKQIREECERLRKENAELEGEIGALQGRKEAKSEGVKALQGLCNEHVITPTRALGLLLLLVPLIPLALPRSRRISFSVEPRSVPVHLIRDSLSITPITNSTSTASSHSPLIPALNTFSKGVFVSFSKLKDTLFKRE